MIGLNAFFLADDKFAQPLRPAPLFLFGVAQRIAIPSGEAGCRRGRPRCIS